VFVSGHPGSTQRLNTVTHLEYLRDNGQPMLLNYLKRQRTMLNKYGAQSEEKARNAQEDLFGVENALKAYTGQQEGLQDKALMAKKRAAEESLRAVVTRDAKKQKEYGDAWDAVAKSRRALPAYENERRFLESGWGFNSKLFDIARTLVRLVEEDQKPNGERLPEYNSSARESLELDLYSPAPIYEDFETFKLADSLAFMRDELGANNPTVQKVLAGKTPEARAAKLVQGTKLKDINYRKQLVAGGAKAVSESTDPMIVLARAIDKEARAVRKRFEDEVAGVERDAYSKIARALFDTEGTKLYPDATFTLRLSYGAVKGYKEDSKQVAPYTDYAGLYRHAAEHGNKFPYQLPQRWTDAKSTLDLRTPFNFVTTNDIIGGNSGSPIINRNAEIVGLVFDGNIQSLVGNFIYDETQNRTVAVDSRGMVEALRKVYKANEIADELTK